MKLTPAICTQCGATLSVDTSKEATVCQYCGTPFITEKAVNLFSAQNNININSSGNTIIINNGGNAPTKSETETIKSTSETIRIDHKYKVTISRKKHLLSASAQHYDFEVDGKKYRLSNGGSISFSTDLKEADILVYEVTKFLDCKSSDRIGHLRFTADGKDITIETDTVGFECFLLKVTKSSNKSVTLAEEN